MDYPHDVTLPRPGDVLRGKYRVENVLGRGGMGVVLAATDTVLDRRVAMKVLSPDVVSMGDSVERFLREGRAAAKIESEHIARVYEVGALENGLPYMVMEFLSGMDLDQLIDQRKVLPAAEVARYVAEACEAIGEAHALGIVHRDLKPANLFLTKRRDGTLTIKVLDFGISKLQEKQNQALTKTTAAMGTPYYMSPEQIRDVKRVGPRSDIWALGVILHELVCGQRPFDGDTLPAISVAIAVEPPKPVPPSVQLPPGFANVIARCLKKEQTERFANVDELRSALLPFIGESTSSMRLPAMSQSHIETGSKSYGQTASDEALTLSGQRSQPSKLPIAVMAAAGAAAVAIIAAFVVVASSGKHPDVVPEPSATPKVAGAPPTATTPLVVPDTAVPAATSAPPAVSAPPSTPTASPTTTTKPVPKLSTAKGKPNVGSATKSMD